jgi:predicted Zn-ribbon and HTH transcriptional regulator
MSMLTKAIETLNSDSSLLLFIAMCCPDCGSEKISGVIKESKGFRVCSKCKASWYDRREYWKSFKELPLYFGKAYGACRRFIYSDV